MAGKKTAAMGFIFVTLLLDIIGLGIIVPVIPKLIAELIHGDMSDASLYGGWLMFSYAIFQFMFSPVLGNLSDRYGRRPVLLFSLIGFGINYIVLAFAPNIIWLFIGRILAGITGASMTTATAYIADISSPEKRAQNFGMIGMAFGLGFIIGPVLGGVLGHYGSRIPFFAAAGVSFLNFAYGYFVLPESLSKENRRKFDWKRANPLGTLKHLNKYPIVSGLIGSLFCVYMASHAVQSTWTYFTIEKFNWDAKMVGYSLGVVGLLVAIVQGGLIRVINPRIGQKKSVIVGMLLYIIGLVLFAFASESWMMFVFLIPYCLGGIAGPALQGLISNQVPANEQGELQGGITSLVSVSSIFGPLLMTHLFSYFTGHTTPIYFAGAPFLMAAIFCILSVVIAYKFLKSVKL